MKSEYAYKINAGNYESLEVRVGVEADTLPNESTDEAFERVNDYVTSKLLEKVADAKRELDLD